MSTKSESIIGLEVWEEDKMRKYSVWTSDIVIYIVGAGGAGREVLGWALDMGLNVGGFLDTDARPVVGVTDYQVVGDYTTWIPKEHERFIMAIGEPTTRKLDAAKRLEDNGGIFFTLVHRLACVPPGAKLGRGCVIYPYASVAYGAFVSEFTLMNVGAWVGHDAAVGRGCTLGPHSGVYGYSVLGEGVYMGGHAVVIPRVAVMDYCTIGAGAVVTKDTRAYQTLIGVPARPLG